MESYRAQMLTALDRVVDELQVRGGDKLAQRVRKARTATAKAVSDTDDPYTVDLATIDAVIKSEETLDGELLQTLLDLAESHGPPLTEGVLDGERLARVLAVAIAMPESPDRVALDGTVDVLAAAVLETDEPRTVRGVLGETYALAAEVGAHHTMQVARRLAASYASENPQRWLATEMEPELQAGRAETLQLGTVLKWIAILAVVVGAVTALTGALRGLTDVATDALGLVGWN